MPMWYIYAGAFHDFYDSPNWKLSTAYNTSVAMPGFAVVDGYNDAAMAKMTNRTTRCTFPSWDQPCRGWNQDMVNLSLSHYGQLSAYTLDTADKAVQSFNSTWNDLVLQIGVNCKGPCAAY
jgi:hypothetical protein